MENISVPLEAKNAPEVKSATRAEKRDYRGFVAGVFSGIAKLSGECSASEAFGFITHARMD